MVRKPSRSDASGPAALARLAVVLTTSLALSAPLAVRAAAQENPSVAPRRRVRVTVPSLGIEDGAGTVLDTTVTELVVRLDRGRITTTIARSDIERMDVSVRRTSRALRGLGIGALVGAGVGAFAGITSGDDPNSLVFSTAEQKAGALAVGLGVVGGPVGLFAGAIHPQDVWAPVTSPAPAVAVRPLLDPGRTGTRVGLHLSLPRGGR